MSLRPVFAALAVLLSSVAWAATPATDFTLRDLDGAEVRLSDYKGKVVFVDFWATWCGPCKDAMPHWQALYQELGPEGFVVLAVTTDDARTKPQVKPYVKRMGFTYPVLYDTDSTALVVYNPAKTLPYSVLIDREFKVHSMHQGYTPGDEDAIGAEVRTLLSHPAPPAGPAKE